MLKNKIISTLILNFALISIAQSSESGGMPQLNPEFWISQIFWLILTFGIMFVVLSKLILPKISKNLETRKSQILENIETAEKQREQSENKIKEYEKLIYESKIEAKNYFSEIRQKVLGDIAKKKQILDNQIEKELKEVEKEIDESEKLRMESKKLLENAQNKLDSASSESKKILEEAKKDSENLIIQMNDKFHKSAEIKKHIAETKMSQMKDAAIKEIKDTSIKIAVESVKKIISTSIDKSKLDLLYEKKLEETKTALKNINS